jgi:hypothetical protein
MCNSSARRIIARAHFRSPKGLTQAHAGQGGITLGLEGEPRADFSNLGVSFTYSLFPLSKIFMLAFPWLELLVSALLWCQRSAFFLCQSTSGVSIFLVTAVFWCQRFSGVSPLSVPALFWCQRFSGVSPFSVPALFWCQPYSGASSFRCQHCSGTVVPETALPMRTHCNFHLIGSQR